MGLFSIFKNNGLEDIAEKESSKIEIPEHIFVDNNDPAESSDKDSHGANRQGLDAVYEYLQSDFDSNGYSDALTNPDESYRQDNVKLLMHDLSIRLQVARSYYEMLMSEINLHIKTRSRSGLVDIVMELEERKSRVSEKMNSIDSMTESIADRSGVVERVILSYNRGFMRGLAALTQSGILNQKL